MKIETRKAHSMKFRSKDGDIKVEGYAAVFNQDANIGGMFTERFAPGAFTKAIKRDDVVFLINHDGLPLARTRSGTLKLTQDDHGLKMSAELYGGDPDVLSIIPKMERGDLDKMSFAFFPEVQEWQETSDLPIRIVKEASLYDVSIVTSPSYEGTEIGLRYLESWRAGEGLISKLPCLGTGAGRQTSAPPIERF